MKRILFLLALLPLGYSVFGQCTEPFFSEYIEGSSNNKAIEVYNPTSMPLDMSPYTIYRFNNGGTTPSGTFAFTGITIAPGDVYVIANSNADSLILSVSDTTSSITFFNGDDALVLVNDSTLDTLDAIGVVGVDPGTNWPVGSGATSEYTLVRADSVQMGTADWNVGATQWLVFAQNTYDSLGAHNMTPCGITGGGSNCNNDLFFSEYIEGSSNNKALEVFNSNDTVVDLSNYVIYRGNNGATSAQDSLFPQGMLNPSEVFVIGNPSANAAILAESDTTHTITFFNGDDWLLLINTTTGDSLDIIGEIGIDPGSGWVVGTGATNNNTIVRMPTVNMGELNWAINATQWLVFPIDMTDSLGAHTMNPCTATIPLSVGFVGGGTTVLESVGSVTVTLAINQPDANPTSVDVTLAGASTATNTVDFNFATPITVTWAANDSADKTVVIPIIDDVLVENLETIVLELSGATNGANISVGTYTINIEDNDIPTYPIGTINTVDASGVADSSGVNCRIVGVVYGENLRPGGLQFTLRDSTGGIGLFYGSGNLGYTVVEGDEVEVYGTINQFNGLTQIAPDSLNFLSAGNTLETPDVITSLGENTESDLVVFECAWLVDTAQWGGGSSGFNVDVTNGTDTFQVRIDADVNLFTAPVPTGILHITGIGGQFDSSSPYDSGYQLLPRYSADIVSVPSPVAAFTGTQGTGFDYSFSDGSSNATSWSWDFGDGNTSTTQNPTHTYASAGPYTVTLVVTGECESDTTTQNIDVLTGLENGLVNGNISIFPNPNNGQARLDLSALTGERVNIVATDLAGRVVFKKAIEHVSQQFETLRLDGESNGLYLIRVESATGVFTGKMVIER